MMPLVDFKDPKDIAAFLYCSSNLEERVFSLYRTMADRTDDQLIKSTFIYIAYDSLKHSVIMKGIAQTISQSAPRTEECENKLKQVWTQVTNLSEEMTGKNKMNDTDLPDMIQRLAGLENSLSEEYFVLVQLKTLQFMAKEIYQLYHIDFTSLKGIFELIIKDEENHREILTSLEDLLRKEPSKDTTPVVRYQHPEAW
jgi:rubrerythrin